MSGADFWSRRKAGVRAEAAAEERARTAEAEAAEQVKLETATDEELLAKFDLPDPDMLKPGDDVSAFMAKAIPDRLRRRALRQLWRLNPTLANIDGLVDYGDDFTDSAMVVENLQTAYQVGRGMLKHVLEMEKAEAAEPADVEQLEEQPAPEDAPEEPEVFADTTDAPPVEAPAPAPVVDEAVAPSRRRMVFAFDQNQSAACDVGGI